MCIKTEGRERERDRERGLCSHCSAFSFATSSLSHLLQMDFWVIRSNFFALLVFLLHLLSTKQNSRAFACDFLPRELGGSKPLIPSLRFHHLSFHRARVQLPEKWPPWSILSQIQLAPPWLPLSKVPSNLFSLSLRFKYHPIRIVFSPSDTVILLISCILTMSQVY